MHNNSSIIEIFPLELQLIGDELYLSALDFYLRLRLSRKEVSPTYVYLLTHRANISYTAQYEPNNYYGT